MNAFDSCVPMEWHFAWSDGNRILSAVKPKTLAEIEREAIEESLNRNSGSKPLAAKELGISLKTLYNKIKLYDLKEREAGR